MGGSISWLITILLLLVTMLANLRARGEDFDNELSFSNGIQPLEGDEEDEQDEDIIESGFSSRFPVWRSQGAGRIPVNVDSFGAVGDGDTDDTKVILNNNWLDSKLQSSGMHHHSYSHNARLLEGVKIQGGGVIDGSGSKWWAASSSTAMQRSTYGIVSLNSMFLARELR